MLNNPMVAKRPAADLGRQSAVDQERRQMHRDEEYLEAAGEEAEHQQHIAAMAECLGERLRRPTACAARRRPAPPAAGTASASDSGMMKRTQAPKITSVCCQPNSPISATASGENRNCPNDPAAVPAPNANVRQAGGISLPNAPITTVNDEPASPKPMTAPAVRCSMPGVFA